MDIKNVSLDLLIGWLNSEINFDNDNNLWFSRFIDLLKLTDQEKIARLTFYLQSRTSEDQVRLNNLEIEFQSLEDLLNADIGSCSTVIVQLNNNQS